MNGTDKVNILMVDDQPAKLLTYETILSELGENLIRAGSGREALEHLLRTDVAVLLIDVHMPDLDGFELASLVRQHPRFQKTAIIFISAVHLTEFDRLRGYQAGAVDYVPVPVVPEILRAKVGVFADLYRKTREMEDMNLQLELRVAERTAALAASEERFRLATEAMRGGLYDWNLQANASWMSPGLAALLGLSTESLDPSAQWWQSRIHSDDLEGGWKEKQSALNAPVPAFDVQYRVQHLDGHWLWVWDRGRVVRNEEGRAIRVVGHVTDISDQKKAEAELKQADQKKDEFLAMLSHELRNPLAPIRSALDVVRLDTPPAQLEKSWVVIDRQVNHLSRLVDDLLDVSRISRNKLELRKSRMNLAEAINAAVEASKPLLDQYNHHLRVSLPKEAVVLEGDLVRLTQAFTNLLNNSAKFTPRGGQIGLTAELEGDQVAVRVKDTGKGIAADELQQLFQMFYQGGDCLSSDGFGIGLTLVARIVELHGGRVEAHSAGRDTGSEFTVRLPVLLGAADTRQSHEPTLTPGREIAVRRVLVADDNVDAAESLALLLKLQGFEVRMARDGLSALETASQFHPDAMLLDLGMPGMNGCEVARAIREQPWGRSIVLVAQTGWGQERDRERTRQAGFDAHLTKPLDYDVLLELLAGSSQGRTAKTPA